MVVCMVVDGIIEGIGNIFPPVTCRVGYIVPVPTISDILPRCRIWRNSDISISVISSSIIMCVIGISKVTKSEIKVDVEGLG